MFKNQENQLLHSLVDLAVQIIDHHITKGEERTATTDVGDGLVTTLVNQFDKHYTRKASVPVYIGFDIRCDRGIPLLVHYFSTFHPVNAAGEFDVWSNYTRPTSKTRSTR